MENLKTLQNRYNAEFVFYNIDDSFEISGEVDIKKDTLKQIIVVLKQSLDAADCNAPKMIEFYFENNKMKLIFTAKGIYGFIVDKNTFGIDVREEEPVAIEEEKRDDKAKVALKERKKVIVKGGAQAKEEEEKAPEKEEPSYAMDSNAFEEIKKIAAQYLEDFAEDIINNLIKESKLKIDNPESDKVEVFIKKLLKSSSLIIGPSSAQEMIDKIKVKLT